MKHYTDLLTNLIGEWEKGGAKKSLLIRTGF
jgi:hypothetical protein